jgi:hypothetical protein
VHVDASAYIALADGGVQCLSGRDLTGYDFLSISKEGFVPVFVKLAFKAQLDKVVFQ